MKSSDEPQSRYTMTRTLSDKFHLLRCVAAWRINYKDGIDRRSCPTLLNSNITKLLQRRRPSTISPFFDGPQCQRTTVRNRHSDVVSFSPALFLGTLETSLNCFMWVFRLWRSHPDLKLGFQVLRWCTTTFINYDDNYICSRSLPPFSDRDFHKLEGPKTALSLRAETQSRDKPVSAVLFFHLVDSTQGSVKNKE